MQFEWKGIFPALTTKFTIDDKLDLPLFEKNLDAQTAAGIHGIVLGGSLGEASTLTENEKEVLVKCSLVKLKNKLPVILNIAESSTADALHQVKNAESWGCDGLMLLPPMRYKSDDRETVQYFATIASATSLPIMIYNNPHDYKINVTLDMFAELAKYENINAVKESSRDITNVTRMINRFGKRFSILNGVDTIALESLCAGADGWVAGLVCAFPKETVDIYTLVQQNKISEARKIYQWFMPLLELDIHPKLVQYIKLAEQYTGIGSEYVRAPRLVLEGKERDEVSKVIKDALANRPQ